MLSWLLIIILSYIFFGLFSFGDKLILSGHLSPKAYTFYVGILNILALFLIPFAKFGFPDFISVLWISLDAVVFILGLYFMFSALQKFDVSRVMPTIGATQPLFIFFLTWAFLGYKTMSPKDFLAFLVLIAGTFIISKEKTFKVSSDYLKLTVVSSLMFSLDYIFLKIVFLRQPFLQGLIWVRIFTFLLVLLFLFDEKFRAQIFVKQKVSNAKTRIIFLITQFSGAVATLLQSFAISLAPIAYLAVMNALRGVQYIFLFLMTLSFSFFFPSIFKENISKKIVIQKASAILLIFAGLAILITK